MTRRAGSRRFLDMHMHVPANWTLGRAAALRGEVEQALMDEVPGLRASIQLLPSNVEAQFNAVEARAVIALVQRVARGAGRDRRQRRRRDRPRLCCSSSAPSPTTARRSPTSWSPRCSRLRIFADAAGKMNLDLAAVGGGLLVVSQFTLAADTSSGNRPGFSAAAAPELGRRLYERVLATARRCTRRSRSGEFGADMQVTSSTTGR